MFTPAPSPSPSSTPPPNLDNGGRISACETYPADILSETVGTMGTPSLADWQYIAHADNSIWAAPLGVSKFWNAYNGDPNKGLESFAVDPDAENFVLNVSGSTNPTPNPARPIAALTYITPCEHESDHPENTGTNDGPAWLAYVINAIGESKYWTSSTIIVTWDDWGGFYDNVPPVYPFGNGQGPIHPYPNSYNNVSPDPNEWGFRVPLIVISPYLKERGYISSFSPGVPRYRSQSVMLQYIEATFRLAKLGTDDRQQDQQDELADMFNFLRSPLPYVPITVTQPFVPGPVGSCPQENPSMKRIHHRPHGRFPVLVGASRRQ